MKRLTALAVVPFLLTGCGGADGNDGDGDAGSGGLPDCADIWVDGQTLPEDYEGCMNGDTIEAFVVYDCDRTTYDDRFYAELGGVITEVDGAIEDDKGYQEWFYADC